MRQGGCGALHWQPATAVALHCAAQPDHPDAAHLPHHGLSSGVSHRRAWTGGFLLERAAPPHPVLAPSDPHVRGARFGSGSPACEISAYRRSGFASNATRRRSCFRRDFVALPLPDAVARRIRCHPLLWELGRRPRRGHVYRGLFGIFPAIETRPEVLAQCRRLQGRSCRKRASPSRQPLFIVPAPVPLEQLPPLLIAADVHLITLRDAFVGYVLPSKVHACIEFRKKNHFRRQRELGRSPLGQRCAAIRQVSSRRCGRRAGLVNAL